MISLFLPALLFLNPSEVVPDGSDAFIGEDTIAQTMSVEPYLHWDGNLSMIPLIHSGSMMLLHLDSGRELLGIREHETRSIASLTKIMTVVVALEHYDLEEVVTISQEAADVGGSQLYLYAGDQIKVKELIYGALIRSGNDAALALAQHAPGGEDVFYGWMNQKAKDLGMYQTYFTNPIGFDDPMHYSTAYDLSLLVRYALKTHPIVSDIVHRQEYVVKSEQGHSYLAENTNELLGTDLMVKGVKTGTTDGAGQSFIASFEWNGETYLVILLHSEERFQDAANIIRWLRLVM